MQTLDVPLKDQQADESRFEQATAQHFEPKPVKCRVCGMADSNAIKFLTRWPEQDLCLVCATLSNREQHGKRNED